MLLVLPSLGVAGLPGGPRSAGAVLASALEQAALGSADVHVVTRGAWNEVTGDLKLPADKSVPDAVLKRAARLAGATHVVGATLTPGKEGVLKGQLRVMDVAAGSWKDAGKVAGNPAAVLADAVKGVFAAVNAPAPPAPVLPATADAQAGMFRCADFASMVLERRVVKGRELPIPADVETACSASAADTRAPQALGAALALAALGGMKPAPAALAEHARAYPEDRLAVMAHARVAFDAGQREDAMAALAALRAKRPNDPDVARMEGELFLESGDAEKARAAFERAANLVPHSPYHRYRLSYATYRAGRGPDALAHARRALELAGGDAAFYQLNLAERLIDEHELEEATTLLEASMASAPWRLTTRVRLGYVYVLRKEADKALKVLSDAEKMTPTEREQARLIPGLLIVDLARAHAQKGNADMAMRYLLRARDEHVLEYLDLNGPDFKALEGNEEFRRLRGR